MADFLGGKDLEKIKVGGVALASILGVIITFSIVRNNMLSAKFMKESIKKLESEGFTDDDFLDNAFSDIQNLAETGSIKPTP